MNLKNKKDLAKKVLGVGRHRIVFNSDSLSEIKEAITKEDIKSLHSQGIISIKPVKGRRKIIKRKTRKGPGKIKMKVKSRKSDYVKMTRKLRRYIKELKRSNKINRVVYRDIRKKIKMRYFRSKAYLEDYISKIKDINVDKNLKKIGKKAGRISIKSGKAKKGGKK
jgi:large subunit ribosomal protein L19e